MDQAKRPFTTVDEYILAFPEPVRTKLQELRRLIRDAAPDAEEPIKYGMPTFTLHGNLAYFFRLEEADRALSPHGSHGSVAR